MAVQADKEPDLEEQQEGQDELKGQMSFLDHLEELRSRIFKMLIAVAIAFCGCYYFAHSLYQWVQRPLTRLGVQSIATSITEGFNLEIKLAFVAAIFVSAPF